MKTTLVQLIKLLGDDITPQLQLTIEDLFEASNAAESIPMKVLPDSMKLTIDQGLTKVKMEIAHLAFSYFSVNDFEPTEEIIPLMRQVVACEYGGVDID